MRTALINNNKVENVIVANPIGLDVLQKALGCDYLIPVDDSVNIGDNYDPDSDIFTNENGERIYPPKTNAERISELESQLANTRAALTELASIVENNNNS